MATIMTKKLTSKRKVAAKVRFRQFAKLIKTNPGVLAHPARPRATVTSNGSRPSPMRDASGMEAGASDILRSMAEQPGRMQTLELDACPAGK